ncbi:MAG: M48 family metalloprotease [Candidatus Dependentiae bacterium]
MHIFKKTLFFGLAIGTLSSPLYAMHHAKRIWSELGTSIHFALASQMAVGGIIAMREDNTHPAPPLIKDFVHTILERENVEKPEKIKVHITKEKSSEYATNGTKVTLAQEEAKILDHILKTDPTNRPYYTLTKESQDCSVYEKWTYQDYLTCSKAILAHEAAHIKNKDVKKMIASCFPIPIGTLLLSRYKPLYQIIKHGMFTKVISGLGLNEINKLIFFANRRHQEKRADEAIVHRDEIKEIIKYLTFYAHIDPKPSSLYELLHNDHPSDMSRINRFAKRLEEMDEVVEE